MKKDLIINVKEKYFQSILNESKTVEGRINKGKFQKINKGDLVSLCSGYKGLDVLHPCSLYI